MNLPKFNSYQGGTLRGTYDIYTKLDGVCVHITPAGSFSKRGKPLYNMPTLPFGYYEAFDPNWDTTVSKPRTQGDAKGRFRQEQLHEIYPGRDARLFIETVEDPTEEFLTGMLDEALSYGNEGLILWPHADCKSQKPIKVKDEITIDVRVTGVLEGTGKYKRNLGALITNYGNIGTGFSDAMRNELWQMYLQGSLIGDIVEASFMEWTKDNKMRHPRFKRTRFDKNTENLER
jgi:hypothetical protein